MDLQAEKLNLVQAILDIEDIGLIKKVKKILKKEEHDWFDDLTEEQQQDVIRGLEQADRGETITHEEAVARTWIMSYSIVWTTQAYTSFEGRIEYLAIHFTDREIKNFRQRVKEYLEVLKEEPGIGKKPGKYKNVHIGLVIKPVSIIYRVKALKKEIEIISFVDNSQDPRKIKKYKT